MNKIFEKKGFAKGSALLFFFCMAQACAQVMPVKKAGTSAPNRISGTAEIKPLKADSLYSDSGNALVFETAETALHLSFKARIHQRFRSSVLSWQPLRKKGIVYEIFRSTDSCRSWNSLGNIPDMGDSMQSCKFYDPLPKERNYYQLRIRLDSSVYFSGIALTDFKQRPVSLLASFYNGPARGCFSFSVKSRCGYSVCDGENRVIAEGEAGGQQAVRNLLPGTYYLNLYSVLYIETFTIHVR